MASVYTITAALIETAFKSYWDGLATKPPLAWANVPFSQPANGEFVRLAVLFGASAQASIGGATRREFVPGSVEVQIFTPKNAGSRRAMAIADLVAAGLRYGQLSGSGVAVELRAPAVLAAGERADAFQVNVAVEFRAQHEAAPAA